MENNNFVNTTDNNGNTPLYYAIQMEDTKEISSLINNGADINMDSSPNCPALLEAIWVNNYEIVAILVNKKAVVNRRCFGRSLLQHAIDIGNEAIINKLVKAGAKLFWDCSAVASGNFCCGYGEYIIIHNGEIEDTGMDVRDLEGNFVVSQCGNISEKLTGTEVPVPLEDGIYIIMDGEFVRSEGKEIKCNKCGRIFSIFIPVASTDVPLMCAGCEIKTAQEK